MTRRAAASCWQRRRRSTRSRRTARRRRARSPPPPRARWAAGGRSAVARRTADRDATFDDVVAARARLRTARGDLDGARADLARLARRRARWNTYPTQRPAILVAPALAAGEGDAARERAERMLREACAW